MACRSVLHSVVLTAPWRPARRSILSVFPPAPFLRSRVRIPTTAPLLGCSLADVPSPALPEDDQGPPQEAVLKAISEVSKSEGRVAQTTNVIIGGTVKDDATNEWLALDQKVFCLFEFVMLSIIYVKNCLF
ncbi:hypothetical protein KSP39_PZI015641 [Platanthera zijinensis]|uniref:Uncharacterized protein n=1 Tax=Platanthera zijinensis TaxID=2320716 RepID=A0AAP0B9Y9_9ASPA